MGRPERRIDGGTGPVPTFAAELRALRESAGRPTYAALARRTGRSQTALSEAAGGRRFPTWETVEAFVSGCAGDVDTWRERWEEVAAAIGTPAAPSQGAADATPTPSAESETIAATPGPLPDDAVGSAAGSNVVAPVPARPDPTPVRQAPAPGAQPRLRRRRTISWLAAAATAVVATAAGVIHALADARPATTPAPEPAAPPSSMVADRADPKDSGCAEDPGVLSVDSVEVSLGRQALGVLELRYAPQCGVSWPRFLPYTVERIPYGTAIHVDVHRPVDGATAEFTADYAGTGIFGNLLHSTRDCVLARVRIEMPEDPAGAAAETSCLRGRVRESTR